MTADWKKKLFEQVQPEPTHAQLLKEIDLLKKQAQLLAQEKKQLVDAARYFADSHDKAIRDQARFNALLSLELMVPTKDGFKLMTGHELFELADNLAYPHGTVEQKTGSATKSVQDLLAQHRVKLVTERAERMQLEMYDYLMGAESWHKLLNQK